MIAESTSWRARCGLVASRRIPFARRSIVGAETGTCRDVSASWGASLSRSPGGYLAPGDGRYRCPSARREPITCVTPGGCCGAFALSRLDGPGDIIPRDGRPNLRVLEVRDQGPDESEAVLIVGALD